MEAIVKFKKVKKNVLNFDSVEIIAFNYDGEGSALVLPSSKGDKAKRVESYQREDLDVILFGDFVTGDIFYVPV